MQRPLFGYVVATLIGAVVFVIVGYFVQAAPGEGVSLGFWLSRPFRMNVFAWVALGAAVGFGLNYLAARR